MCLDTGRLGETWWVREFKRQDRLKTQCWRKSKNCQTQASRFSKLLGLMRLLAKGQKPKLVNVKVHRVKPNCSASYPKLQCQLPRVLSEWSHTGWAFSFQQQILTTHGMCSLYRGISCIGPTGFTGDNSYEHTPPEYTIPDSTQVIQQCGHRQPLFSVLERWGTLSKYHVCRHQSRANPARPALRRTAPLLH